MQVLTNSVIDRSVSILATAMTIKTTMLVMVGSGKVHTHNDNNTKCIKMCSRFSASLGLGLGLGINVSIIYLVAVPDELQYHTGNSNHHSLN